MATVWRKLPVVMRILKGNSDIPHTTAKYSGRFWKPKSQSQKETGVDLVGFFLQGRILKNVITECVLLTPHFVYIHENGYPPIDLLFSMRYIQKDMYAGIDFAYEFALGG